jgi:hypothetical protein
MNYVALYRPPAMPKGELPLPMPFSCDRGDPEEHIRAALITSGSRLVEVMRCETSEQALRIFRSRLEAEIPS